MVFFQYFDIFGVQEKVFQFFLVNERILIQRSDFQLKRFLWWVQQVFAFPYRIPGFVSYCIVHRILEIGIVFYRCGTFRLFLSLEAGNNGSLLSSDRIVVYVRRFCRLFLTYVIFYWWGFRFFSLLGDSFWLLFQIIQKKSDGLLWAYWSDRFFFLNGQKVRNSLVMRVVFSGSKARGVPLK